MSSEGCRIAFNTFGIVILSYSTPKLGFVESTTDVCF